MHDSSLAHSHVSARSYRRRRPSAIPAASSRASQREVACQIGHIAFKNQVRVRVHGGTYVNAGLRLPHCPVSRPSADRVWRAGRASTSRGSRQGCRQTDMIGYSAGIIQCLIEHVHALGGRQDGKARNAEAAGPLRQFHLLRHRRYSTPTASASRAASATTFPNAIAESTNTKIHFLTRIAFGFPPPWL